MQEGRGQKDEEAVGAERLHKQAGYEGSAFKPAVTTCFLSNRIVLAAPERAQTILSLASLNYSMKKGRTLASKGTFSRRGGQVKQGMAARFTD